MPTYVYRCPDCGLTVESVRRVAERDMVTKCSADGAVMEKVIGAPLFKFAGRVTPGGGPDRFTADMLGVPLKDLPAGLRTPQEKHKL